MHHFPTPELELPAQEYKYGSDQPDFGDYSASSAVKKYRTRARVSEHVVGKEHVSEDHVGEDHVGLVLSVSKS